jgi:hypothetical protein
VHRAPGIPHALFGAETKCNTSGASRREGEVVSEILSTSLRANGSRECAPHDRLREAIHRAAKKMDFFVAALLAMTVRAV